MNLFILFSSFMMIITVLFFGNILDKINILSIQFYLLIPWTMPGTIVGIETGLGAAVLGIGV